MSQCFVPVHDRGIMAWITELCTDGQFGQARRRAAAHVQHPLTKAEKRTRELNEVRKRVAELEYKVATSQQAAQAAIRLLQPYSVDRKPAMPLRRVFERTGKT